MVVMKIKLYKDSAGALLAEFLDGINSVSQNNSNVNEVLVVLDNFELAVGEVLRIGYELSTGEEVEDYTLMTDNFDGTYSAGIPYAVANSETDSEWQLGLQISSNWVENESFTGYRNKQNLVTPLLFTVNNAVKDRNGKYPKIGDIQTLYDQAVEKIDSEGKNAEEIEKLKNEKGQPNGIATLDENGKVPTEQLPDDIGGGGGGGGSLPEGFNPEDYVKVDDRDKFVKEGLTENDLEMSEEEKTKACDFIGSVKIPNTTLYGNYVLSYVVTENGKVGKIGEPMRVQSSAGANTIPSRGPGGVVYVGIPSDDVHATPMGYVNNLPDYLEMTDEQKAKWISMLGISTETWTFTLEDGTTVTETVLTFTK
jgi:hypothetical protein